MYTKILKNRTGVDGLEEAFYWNGNIALIRNAGAKPGEYKEIAKLNHQDSETPFNPIEKLPF